jgi:UDP-glucose 4-epimerase
LKVLIVGGSGFLGRPIVNEFLQQDFEVKSLSRHILSPSPDVESIKGNIFDADSYKVLLETWQPELVVQAAWQTESGTYRTDPINALYSNSTINFARDCFENGTKKFIGLGSAAEYGNFKSREKTTSIPFEPNDSYGASKVRTFQELMQFADQGEVNISWARIFQPYGRNQDSERLIPSIVLYLKSKNNLTINSPFTELDWISSRDVARAIHFISTQSKSDSYDVGTGILTTTYDLFFLIKELLLPGNPRIEFPGDIRKIPEPNSINFNSSNNGLTKLGWSPSDSLDTGLRWSLEI